MSHIHNTLSNIILQLATLSPGLGNRTRLFMSLTPGLGPRSGDKSLGLQLVTAQRFILGLKDMTTMPSIRSINLP